MKKLLGFIFLAISFNAQCFDSVKVAIVKAQINVEAGEFDKAKDYLAKATLEYPNNDVLFALYGQALYESKQFKEAELKFRYALQINPLNSVAKSYIEVIRETNTATISEKAKQFEDISFDKIGDLIAMAFAFLLASIMNTYLIRFSEWRFEKKSKSLFLKGDYDDFADLLELQIGSNSLKPLRHSLSFMLLHKSSEEALNILELYVNTDENFQVLKRMIKQDVKKSNLS
ncbi:tetratricopeptide repeat protein [Pseudoalteromonas denitrificans]|uniref:TPR repeat-containing protein n=1 Tax=Pseudoalteromonas denitrificans DSM 6059 TaxID=1123010 RepID=A0A1I1FH30_9GAMM|nr:tetratricopeptide repeat protein [Pseudoalteromonas denitrificans]SFB98675.1 TPR repeat-containing protein [Pseudoalteromonas denitrificans DSM 6059]